MKSSLPFILLPFALGFTALAEENPPQPNVLFIAVDDLNDWIGCMKGHPQARTPNIDRLAERGMLFTNAHCAAPVCLASRTALFSGRYPDQTGVFSNWGKTKGKAPAKSWQMPLHFAASGYETLGAGKLYHSASPQFFDDYYDTENRWSPFTQEQARYIDAELPTKSSAKPRHLIQNGPGGRDWILPLNGLPSERNPDSNEGESFDWGPVDVADEEMGDTRVTQWATKKIEEKRAKPFFLGVGYYRPHIPLFAPQQDFDSLPPVEAIQLPASIPDDLDDIGEAGRKFALDPITAGTHKLVTDHDQWQEAVRAYLACITYVDRQIGSLVTALNASPHADNTWIILFSDHGWQLGEKQHWGKWTGWRASTRLPLIIVPPASFQAARGKVCAEAVSLMDLYPTLIEVCNLAEKKGVAGQSLVPLMKNPALETGRGVITAFDPGNHALSTRDWRYLRYHSGEEELYDIQADPHEWHNLAQDTAHQARLGELRTQLEEELKNIR
ncbi:iduronate 2-sulfatase [Prosthecobacter fusiformis]|uniref:Iduronate 2-sulfatase n=1 Tax=Prosthecobacter fusiformis TaxID=48464 RepID=A0A4R7RZ42_9BACT|nr:sulfatase [Prosthecobacter fusiformis]TDU71131.1 iduronate 2-sulfatase [Prosthecobacter fusiformis]